jgi:hypothetical protein
VSIQLARQRVDVDRPRRRAAASRDGGGARTASREPMIVVFRFATQIPAKSRLWQNRLEWAQ